MITDKIDSKYSHMYAWINPVTGAFSDSWTEETHISHGGTTRLISLNNPSSGYSKIIKYECLNDKSFEFTRHMKLK